jgi:hypothetical protein
MLSGSCASKAVAGRFACFTFLILRRDAVLLVGADKTGDDRFYQRLIPLAERLWETFQKEQGFK